jgi:cytochrome c oxidase subunit 2
MQVFLSKLVSIGVLVFFLSCSSGMIAENCDNYSLQDITIEKPKEGVLIEIFGEQFQWRFRYAGVDNKLSPTDFKLISNSNPFGIVNNQQITNKLLELDSSIFVLNNKLVLDSITPGLLSKQESESIKTEINKVNKLKLKVDNLKTVYALEIGQDHNDDLINLQELHLIKGLDYEFTLRSKDVVHSAYFPHFRLQMNVLPGMETKLNFTPNNLTCDEQVRLNKPEFNFILMCNKICGKAHFGMTKNVVVETEHDFMNWIRKRNSNLKE